MLHPKSILHVAIFAILASNALAEAIPDDYTVIEPAHIEQLASPSDSQEAVPEPGTFGAICVGVAVMIYARRWRRRI